MKLNRPLLFATALAMALGAHAEGMGGTTGSGSSSAMGSPASVTDNKSFATQAAQDGLAEVAMGTLALERASDPSVKQFAQELVTAHDTNNKQLMKIARSEGITLPKTLSSEDKQMRDELSRLSGSEFDQRFIQAQIEDHQKAIDLFQSQADNGSGQLQQYAKNTLPHLQAHLDAANQLASQMEGSGMAGSSGAGGSSGGGYGSDAPTGSGNGASQ